jgi:hypothetical protein
MSWSGGTYTKGNNSTGGWTGDASVGIGIEAGRHDTQDNDFATGINTCIAKDGQNAATADLPMGGFKHTNVATATARNNYAAVSQVQDGDFIWLGTTGGTATAMTASATPAITAYKAGQKFRMLTGTASTGTNVTAHTLDVNGLGAKSVKTSQGAIDCTIGDWTTGALLELVYDGSTFRVANAAGAWASYAPTLTPTGGTASSTSFSTAVFQKFSRMCTFHVYVTWTQGTATASNVAITLPIASFYNNLYIPAMGTRGAATVATGFALTSTGGTVVNCYNYDQAVFALGSNSIFLTGSYITA